MRAVLTSVFVENYFTDIQIARGVDISKDPMVADVDLHDNSYIPFQQMSCSFISLQHQQLFEIMRGKTDRMAAFAIAGRCGQPSSG